MPILRRGGGVLSKLEYDPEKAYDFVTGEDEAIPRYSYKPQWYAVGVVTTPKPKPWYSRLWQAILNWWIG